MPAFHNEAIPTGVTRAERMAAFAPSSSTRRIGVAPPPDREQAFAKTALALMGERGVVATPDNFELFYAYACGAHPAITQVMGAIIECPKHNGRFDFRTGAAKGAPVCINLATYPVKVEGGRVFLNLG